MNIKKLNATGFAHVVALAVVIVGVAIIGTAVLVVSHADAASCVNQNFGTNSSGQCVKDLQILANVKAYTSPKLSTDGQFGPLTKQGVKQVQAGFGLSQDGIVGPNTWKVLCNVSAITNHSGGGGPTQDGPTIDGAYKNAGC